MNIDLAPPLPRQAYAYTGGVAPEEPIEPACVVFVHGALHDHSVWTLAARWFAHHGWRAFAVDLPGHGRSDGPPLARVEDMAGWLAALLDAAHLPRAHLVGHSMGSLVVLELAARRPDKAASLVLVGTAAPMTVSPALLQTAQADPLRAMDAVDTWSHSTLAAKPSYPGPGTWLRGANRALMQRMQARAAPWGNLFEIDFRACDGYAVALDAAARVRCPAHCLVGTRDVMTPERAARPLAEALNARVQRLDAGHAVMQEAPDALLAALRHALGA